MILEKNIYTLLTYTVTKSGISTKNPHTIYPGCNAEC